MKKVVRLVQGALEDKETVAAVSQLLLSGALRAGLRVSNPAAQVISILILSIGRGCLELFVAEEIRRVDHGKRDRRTDKESIDLNVLRSDELH